MTAHDRWLDEGQDEWYGDNDSAYLEEDDMEHEIDAYVEQQIEKECWYEDHPESGY